MFTLLWRGLLGFCPHCGQDRFTDGLLGTRPQCRQCGLAYQGGPGDFTGAAAIAYGVVSIPVLLFCMVLVTESELSPAAILALGVGLIGFLSLASHQPIKGLWLALLVHTGALLPPGQEHQH
jgi:uncharacterized protein (DUF983 family)